MQAWDDHQPTGKLPMLLHQVKDKAKHVKLILMGCDSWREVLENVPSTPNAEAVLAAGRFFHNIKHN
eukprot:1156026-Pelagomonas_calceolata.AAC.13